MTLERRSLPQEIAATIEEWIFQEALQQGEPLKELHLAKRLGVSQTPVREALRILEQRGLVIYRPNRGTTVTTLTQKDIDEILTARIPLESLALELARARATDEERADLAAKLKELASTAKEDDLLKYHRLHSDFHRSVWRLSHNAHLCEALDRLCVPLWAFYRQRVRTKRDRSLSGGRTHQPIVRFILNPDEVAPSAHDLMKEHFGDVAGFDPNRLAGSE